MLKKTIYLKISLLSIISGFAPYILISKTILSYHILEGLFDFLLVTAIFISFNFFLKKENIISNFAPYKFLLNIFMIFIILIYPFLFRNIWIDRSAKIKLSYEKHFKNIDNIDKKEIIVSNDKYVRFYLFFKSRNYLPEDGFFNISKKDTTYQNIAKILPLKKDFKDDFLLCMYLKSATENLFDSTRSTKSKTINYHNLERLKKINSTSGWVLTIPNDIKNKIYKLIKNNQKPYYYYDIIHGYTELGAEKNKCRFEKIIN